MASKPAQGQISWRKALKGAGQGQICWHLNGHGTRAGSDSWPPRHGKPRSSRIWGISIGSKRGQGRIFFEFASEKTISGVFLPALADARTRQAWIPGRCPETTPDRQRVTLSLRRPRFGSACLWRLGSGWRRWRRRRHRRRYGDCLAAHAVGGHLLGCAQGRERSGCRSRHPGWPRQRMPGRP